MKNIIIAILVVVFLGGGYYLYTRTTQTSYQQNQIDTPTAPTTTTEPTSTEPAATTTDATTTDTQKPEEVVGTSVDGRDIIAYHYGSGTKEVLFIGGIHGGYEWNTSLVAYRLMDYLKSNPDVIPADVTVTVIPVMNPDGLYKVTGTTGRFNATDITATDAEQVAGRFNANDVDLNRNFACKWQPTGTWQNKSVSGGSAAFSEPEAQAIKSYVTAHTPAAIVTWYSAAGGVFASNCDTGVSAETKALTNLYANASGYPAYQSFDFYKITGDMVNWFASQNIPAISVLLTNHTDIEWSKNEAGIKAILNSFAQ